MKSIQISVSQRQTRTASWGASITAYHFFFRTDWMDEIDAKFVLEEFKQSFPKPKWNISVTTRETIQSIEEL